MTDTNNNEHIGKAVLDNRKEMLDRADPSESMEEVDAESFLEQFSKDIVQEYEEETPEIDPQDIVEPHQEEVQVVSKVTSRPNMVINRNKKKVKEGERKASKVATTTAKVFPNRQDQGNVNQTTIRRG